MAGAGAPAAQYNPLASAIAAIETLKSNGFTHPGLYELQTAIPSNTAVSYEDMDPADQETFDIARRQLAERFNTIDRAFLTANKDASTALRKLLRNLCVFHPIIDTDLVELKPLRKTDGSPNDHVFCASDGHMFQLDQLLKCRRKETGHFYNPYTRSEFGFAETLAIKQFAKKNETTVLKNHEFIAQSQTTDFAQTLQAFQRQMQENMAQFQANMEQMQQAAQTAQARQIEASKVTVTTDMMKTTAEFSQYLLTTDIKPGLKKAFIEGRHIFPQWSQRTYAVIAMNAFIYASNLWKTYQYLTPLSHVAVIVGIGMLALRFLPILFTHSNHDLAYLAKFYLNILAVQSALNPATPNETKTANQLYSEVENPLIHTGTVEKLTQMIQQLNAHMPFQLGARLNNAIFILATKFCVPLFAAKLAATKGAYLAGKGTAAQNRFTELTGFIQAVNSDLKASKQPEPTAAITRLARKRLQEQAARASATNPFQAAFNFGATLGAQAARHEAETGQPPQCPIQ